jgi:hypothetical protein
MPRNRQSSASVAKQFERASKERLARLIIAAYAEKHPSSNLDPTWLLHYTKPELVRHLAAVVAS